MKTPGRIAFEACVSLPNRYRPLVEQPVGWDNLPDDAQALWEATAQAVLNSRWISVNDRLPETDDEVLVSFSDGTVSGAYCAISSISDRRKWFTIGGEWFREKLPTHWQPKPLAYRPE